MRFDLGAEKSEFIELRGLKERFYPGQQITKGDPKPTFLAFFAGSNDRAGTAWPHEDGKGHRLKLRQALEDGVEIELRSTGHFTVKGDNRRIRARKPAHRPRGDS